MIEVEPRYLTIKYRMEYLGQPDPVGHPASYPMNWKVSVAADVFEDEYSDGQEMEVGGAYLRIIPSAGDINLFMTMDAVDQEVTEFAEFLDFKRPDLMYGLKSFGGDLMILSTLRIKPEFRGQKLGHAILEAILSTIGRNCPLVILRASPMLESGEDEPPADSPAKTALRRYWEEFGFDHVGDDYMVLGGDDASFMDQADHTDALVNHTLRLAAEGRRTNGSAEPPQADLDQVN